MSEPKIIYADENGDIPEFDKKHKRGKKGALFIVFFLFFAFLMGIVGGVGSTILLTTNESIRDNLGLKDLNINTTKTEKVVLEESSAIIDSVKKVSPAVVSISTSDNVTDFFGRTIEEKGGGTGFIITNDGMIVTNKHVVESDSATYTVFTSDGKDYLAKIIAKDAFNDLAVIKIEASGLPTVELGDSDNIEIGQWVVAIGNALGEFSNTVTVGVISATERQITATGGSGLTENLAGLLQTDTAINSGNSGGPLINIKGQVIGINTAVAGNAQNIGFAIPINSAKKAIDSIKKSGKISRPMMGVRYVPITKEIAKANQLSVDYGIWVLRGTSRSDVAVVPGSPADKAGIVENDIITAINGDNITEKQTLLQILQKYNVGDKVGLTLLRKGKEMKVDLTLAEME
ncbi:MAG: protease Do [uncultured bacterium]|nr:MAG: protease Do [uncultured bacterium]